MPRYLSIPPLILGALLLASCSGVPRNQAGAEPHWKNRYPINGMSSEALVSALTEIKSILPTDKVGNIIYMEVQNENCIRIRTGREVVPLAGQGHVFTFKRIDGKWNMYYEGIWVS